MLRLIYSRLLWAVPVIAAVLIINFVLMHLVPGDPITALIGDFPAPPEYVARLRAEFGLDKSVGMQLLAYLAMVCKGQLGFSFFNREPVVTLLAERACNTLILMVPVIVISTVLGVAVGALAALQRSRTMNALITGLTLAGRSVPVFWSGQILILAFAVDLGWLPDQGMHDLRAVGGGGMMLWDLARHWVMPGLLAVAFSFVVVARVARVSFKHAITQDFVTTGKAIGLSHRNILLRHILPNGLIPVITVVGNNLALILTETIIVEAVFGWPGLGQLFVSSIASRDYPVLEGIFLLVAVVTILANLLTDMLYAIVDPRVRSGYDAD